MKVRFAVSVALGPPDPELLGAVLPEAESLGFDTLWFSDVPSLPTTDPLAAVAFAAALTRRVKLGVNLIPFGYRPYVFAHKVAQLDQLCAGRLLVTLVPGLEFDREREALGTSGKHRGRLLDALIPDLRAWWADDDPPVASLAVRPVQEPLEIWLGGSGPEAIRRAGRLADGWLGAAVSPDQAGAILAGIQNEAAATGRVIDPEHFGLSIGYARQASDVERAVRLPRPRRRGEGAPEDLSEIVPVGPKGLRELLAKLVDQGLSKFVLRPVAPVASAGAWHDELGWLAQTVLELQT